jgi:cation:H+ antiporter
MLVLYTVLSLIFLIISGDIFLRGTLLFCNKFKIPPFVLGATIISFGTSMPDFFVAATGTFNGHYDISVGSIIGSSIINILAGIGVAALIGGVKYDRQDLITKFGMYYFICLVFLLVSMLIFTQGKIGIGISIFLCASIFVFIFVNIKYSLNTEEERCENISNSSFCIGIVLFICGLLGLFFFSKAVLDLVIKISEQYLVSKKVIATSLIGLANSLPEITTCAVAAYRKRCQIIIGNIIGSNIMIIGGVLGFSSLFTNIFTKNPIEIVLPILMMDFPILLACSSIFFLLYKFKSEFGKITGLIFIFIYLLYTLLQLSII